ncbi:BQ2448_5064 [Microbotryum intermedium]|uniref:BQ2448_5064 protein n=1 Tax=Microbotryum intermedium TaxID=269621 RepID=A0A238F648_9BASI|nr:BQ2448_5064 [Microbotryum intermedium]
MRRASTSRHTLDTPDHDHDPVQLRLEQLFPSADPAYLAQVIQHHRKQRLRRTSAHDDDSHEDGNDDKALIKQVYHKLVEVNHHEYPRCVRRPLSQDDARPSSILRHDQIQKRWQQTVGGNGTRTGTGHRKQKQNPTLPPHTMELDRTLMMNQAIIRLHTLFPTTPISDLRDVVSVQPHSYLFLATEELLLRQASATKSKSATPAFNWHTFFTLSPNENRYRAAKPAPPVPTLTRDDLLRSPRHVAQLVEHLQRMHPHVPTSSIRSIVAEGGSYSTIQEAVANWRQRQSKVKVFFTDLFAAPPSRPLGFHASAALVTDPDELVQELAQVSRQERVLLERRDEELARQLNVEWTPEANRFECGCCFSDDVTFEEIVPCMSGQHFVCRSCLVRIVQEMVHGGTIARRSIQCMSTDGCEETIHHERLEHILPPSLKMAWDHRLAQNEIEAWAGTIEGGRRPILARCPFCPYVEEVVVDPLWDRFLPLLGRAFPANPLRVLSDLFFTVLNLCLLPVLYLFTIYVILCNPAPFTPFYANADANDVNLLAHDVPAPPALHRHPLLVPHRCTRVAARFLAAQARIQLLRSSCSNTTTLFRCRNTPNSLPLPPFGRNVETTRTLAELLSQPWWPLHSTHPATTSSEAPPLNSDTSEWCGRTSCRLCHQLVPSEGMHACNQDRQESLRLAIETAMSEAVKRVCTKCGVAFTKDSGCNKMTCPRCGAQSCYVCRQTIGEESYAHFCQHFRPLPGRPCAECRKCSLWDTTSDADAAAKAAERARQAWLKDQPSTEHSLIRPTVVGPALELQDPGRRVVVIGPPLERYERFDRRYGS